MKTLVIVAALAAAFVLPATAGAVTVGTSTVYSSSSSNGRGVAQAYRFTAPSSGQVNRLNLYLDGASTASKIEVGLYSGSLSSAGTLRARCEISSPRANAWNRCSFTTYAVTSGASYWLALLQPSDSSGRLRYREGRIAGGPVIYQGTIRSLSSLPASWTNGASRSGGYQASIYADQAASTPPPPPPPADTDGDGVPDSSDQCPGTPAGTRVGANGCPAASTQPPTANFSISPNPAVRTQPTTFTATGSCSDAPCTLRWLHGDATSTEQFGTGQSATFTYTGPTGTRTVTLLATDADGQTDTETKSLNLVEASAPLAACANGRDDDNDGLTDMADPGCTGPTDNDESNVLPPPPAGKPGPDNTGLTVPLSELTPRTGPITVNQAGAVLEKLDITYTGSQTAVQVNAPNVTIRNVRIRSNGISLIQTDGATGLVIEDSELTNRPAAGQPNCHNAIAMGNYTARRLDISGCENGAEMADGNATLVDSWIHDLDNVGPSYFFGNQAGHPDGVQLQRGAHSVVRHNTIDPIPSGESGGTSGIIAYEGDDDVRIEDNWIDGQGSSYAVYAPRTAKSAWFLNRNRLGRGVYGYTACVRLAVTVTDFTGNVDATTGVAVAPDNGVGGGCTN